MGLVRACRCRCVGWSLRCVWQRQVYHWYRKSDPSTSRRKGMLKLPPRKWGVSETVVDTLLRCAVADNDKWRPSPATAIAGTFDQVRVHSQHFQQSCHGAMCCVFWPAVLMAIGLCSILTVGRGQKKIHIIDQVPRCSAVGPHGEAPMLRCRPTWRGVFGRYMCLRCCVFGVGVCGKRETTRRCRVLVCLARAQC